LNSTDEPSTSDTAADLVVVLTIKVVAELKTALFTTPATKLGVAAVTVKLTVEGFDGDNT